MICAVHEAAVGKPAALKSENQDAQTETKSQDGKSAIQLLQRNVFSFSLFRLF